jgi:hypothetical protein
MADSKVKKDHSKQQLAQLKMVNMSKSEPDWAAWHSKMEVKTPNRRSFRYRWYQVVFLFSLSMFGMQLSNRRVYFLYGDGLKPQTSAKTCTIVRSHGSNSVTQMIGYPLVN